MIFIWGRRTYCRKSVSPEEIGYSSTMDNMPFTQFELTQEFGHLYWIPVFPMSLNWHARGKDGKLYHVTPALEQELNQVPYSKASLIPAFAWPIIIVGGGIIYKLLEIL